MRGGGEGGVVGGRKGRLPSQPGSRSAYTILRLNLRLSDVGYPAVSERRLTPSLGHQLVQKLTRVRAHGAGEYFSR